MRIVKMCKVIIVSIILIVIVRFGQSALAAPIDKVDYNGNTQMLTVTGSVYLDSKRYINDVTLQVFKPLKNVNDLQNATTENIDNIIQYIGQKTPDSNGNYQFSYKMNSEVGVHTVRVLLPFDTSEYMRNFPYYDSSFIPILTGVIRNCGSVDDLKRDVIDKYIYLFNEFALYKSLLQSDPNRTFLTPVCETVLENKDSYNSVDDVINLFNREITLQVINSAGNGSDIFATINTYDSVLGIEKDKVFTEIIKKDISEHDRIDMFDKMVGKDYVNSTEMINDLFEQAVLYVINHSTNWKEIRPILDKSHDFLVGFDFTTYDELDTDNGKAEVDKAIIDNISYSSISTLEEYFNDTVKQVKNDLEEEANTETSKSPKKKTQVTYSSNPVVTPTIELTPKPEDLVKKEFIDLDTVPWAVDSINSLARQNVITINDEGKYYPENKVTREEFVKMIVQAFDLVDASATTNFRDVEPDKWYYVYIASAQKNGIANGMSNGMFGIGRYITREEMSVLVYRAMEIKYGKESDNVSKDLLFSDDNQISEYARECVYNMKNSGIINGYTDGRFAPKDYSTRAEAAKIIFGLLEFIKK